MNTNMLCQNTESHTETKSDTPDETNEDDVDWMTTLDADTKGNYLSTATNINIGLGK